MYNVNFCSNLYKCELKNVKEYKKISLLFRWFCVKRLSIQNLEKEFDRQSELNFV